MTGIFSFNFNKIILSIRYRMSKYTVPKIWGPYFWFVMRCTAYNYSQKPDDVEFKQTKNFYISLQHILPCKTCKKSYAEHMKKYPIDPALKNRTMLMEWVETIYNETQKNINKTDKPAPEKSKFENKNKIQVQKQQNYVKIHKTGERKISAHKQSTEKQKPIKINRTVITSKPKPKMKQDSSVKMLGAPKGASTKTINIPYQERRQAKPAPSVKRGAAQVKKDNVKIQPIPRVEIRQPEEVKNYSTRKPIDMTQKRLIHASFLDSIKKRQLGKDPTPLSQRVKIKSAQPLLRDKKKFTVVKRCNCGKT